MSEWFVNMELVLKDFRTCNDMSIKQHKIINIPLLQSESMGWEKNISVTWISISPLLCSCPNTGYCEQLDDEWLSQCFLF